MNRTRTVLMILGLAVAVGQANAEPPSMGVRFADLNVSQPEGASVLFHRLQYAAKVVCDGFDGADLARKAHFRSCVNEALTQAVEKINQPALTTQLEAWAGPHATTIRIAGR